MDSQDSIRLGVIVVPESLNDSPDPFMLFLVDQNKAVVNSAAYKMLKSGSQLNDIIANPRSVIRIVRSPEPPPNTFFPPGGVSSIYETSGEDVIPVPTITKFSLSSGKAFNKIEIDLV